MAYVAGPYIGPHLYVQWGGKLPGAETWSCGIRMTTRNGGPWPATDAADNLTAISNAVQAFHSRPQSMIDPAAVLQYVKVNMIGADGHYVLPTTNEHVYNDTPGAGNSKGYPNQVALAVSLLTAFSRGPAHEGRFYLPLPTAAVQPNGAIQTIDQLAVKGSAQTFIDQLNGVSPKYSPAVFSRKSGAPAQHEITGVKIGAVLDTQRRRRRSLPEAYV